MTDIIQLIQKKIENPVELLNKVETEFKHITKEYVLNADLSQLAELRIVKENINNKHSGLLAKIDLFLDIVKKELEPITEPLTLAKKRLNEVLLNIKELDIIEKDFIIANNYKECFGLIDAIIPQAGLTIDKMKTLAFFADLSKKAKTIKTEEVANTFINKFNTEILLIEEQAKAYKYDYLKDYDLQKVLLKKIDVERIKEKEAEAVAVVNEALKSVAEVEVKEIKKEQEKSFKLEIFYSDNQKLIINQLLSDLEAKGINFNIIK